MLRAWGTDDETRQARHARPRVNPSSRKADDSRRLPARLARPRIRPSVTIGLAALVVTLLTFSPSINVFTSSMHNENTFPRFAYVSLACAIVVAALLGRPGGLGGGREDGSRTARARAWLLGACVAAFVAGNLGYLALVLVPQAGVAVQVVLAVVVGVSSPAACLLWCHECAMLDLVSALLNVGCALVVYGAYCLACGLLGLAFSVPAFALAVVGVVAVPLRHGALSALATADPPARPLTKALADAHPGILAPIVGLAVFAFVMGFRRGGMDVDEWDLVAGGFVIAGLAAAAFSHVVGTGSPFTLHYRVILPTCSATLVPLAFICSLAGLQGASMLCIYVLFGLVGAFSLAALVTFSQSGEINSLRLVATVYALYCCFSLLGLVIIEGVPEAGDHQAIVFVGLSLVYFTLLSVQPNLERLIPKAAGPERRGDEGGSTPDDVSATCERIGVEADLSPRETQILGWLAHGFSASYVAGVLVIAESTARTHVTNIYRKLGVRSRDELLELVGRRRGDGCGDARESGGREGGREDGRGDAREDGSRRDGALVDPPPQTNRTQGSS